MTSELMHPCLNLDALNEKKKTLDRKKERKKIHKVPSTNPYRILCHLGDTKTFLPLIKEMFLN